MDYSAFFSQKAAARKPSALRELFDTFPVDGSYVLMAGGLPNPSVFPLKHMQLTLTDGTQLDIDEPELHTGLQYGTSNGRAELIQFINDLNKRLHDPPTLKTPDHPGVHCAMATCGAQDAMYKVFEVLLQEDDVLITADYTYANVMAAVQPLGCRMQAVRADKDGIIPDSLAQVLSKFPKPEDGKPSLGKLKALYCVPNGDNPTGARYSTERKRQIYQLAQEYNFFIIEDDAYYFLEERPHNESFLSMDVDGRVIRLDTFSKTVAPGLRIGYVCAPKPIYHLILKMTQSSTQGCSHISQVILMQLLRVWGVDGYIEHCKKVSQFYDERRRTCDQIARKHLKGLADWSTPSGGMFLWVKLPDVIDSETLAMYTLVARKVLIVAGAAFSTHDDTSSSYVRISYSKATDEEMEKGFSIIAEEIRKVIE